MEQIGLSSSTRIVSGEVRTSHSNPQVRIETPHYLGSKAKQEFFKHIDTLIESTNPCIRRLGAHARLEFLKEK